MLFMICLRCGAVLLATQGWRRAHIEHHQSLGLDLSLNEFEPITLSTSSGASVTVDPN